VPADEWAWLEAGLKQRITALNFFIDDIYHKQRIIKDRVLPREVLESAKSYRSVCQDLTPPRGIWCHITGTDLVRNRDGQIYVLEDNLRCPSGVSYVLQNRLVMKRSFPQIFEASRVMPVTDYASRLLHMLKHLAPDGVEAPTVVLLTPGIYNSAYYEHFVPGPADGRGTGRRLGLGGPRRVRAKCGPRRISPGGRDLPPPRRRLHRPADLPPRLDVRRAGADGGVPLRAGGVGQRPGTGVADDKVIYAYIGKIIRYYLGEEMLIPNVPTYVCFDPYERKYVLEHLHELVVKAANESGGYGMLVGPHASAEEREKFRGFDRARIRAIISPSPRCRCPVCPRLWATISRAGTSICGPTFCSGKRSMCCPAV